MGDKSKVEYEKTFCVDSVCIDYVPHVLNEYLIMLKIPC